MRPETRTNTGWSRIARLYSAAIRPLALLMVFAFGTIHAGEAEDHRRALGSVIAQIRADSPVVAGMMGGIRNLVIIDESLPNSTLASTSLDGGTVTIRVDVGKVLRNHHSLAATIIHEITHADDMVSWPVTFANIEHEDRDLPWAERRLEKRAIQRTGFITAYLALQFPGRYVPSEPQQLAGRP